MQPGALAGFAGAVLMTRSHKHRVLLVTVELRQTAVAGGGVTRVFVAVCSRGNNVVGFSNQRRSPGDQSVALLTGSSHHHISGRTGL